MRASTASRRDVNSFQVYAYGKWLAIDPGYETPKSTRTHNTLLVDGRGQLGEGTTWFDRETVLANGASSGIIKAETSPTYDHTVGDAMNIYPATSRLTRFQRHFVHLKPDVIIVVDDLESNRGVPIEWLLHTEKNFTAAQPLNFGARNEGVEMDVQFLLSGDARAPLDLPARAMTASPKSARATSDRTRER